MKKIAFIMAACMALAACQADQPVDDNYDDEPNMEQVVEEEPESS